MNVYSSTPSLHPFEFQAQAAPTEKHPSLASLMVPLINSELVQEDVQSRPREAVKLPQTYLRQAQGLLSIPSSIRKDVTDLYNLVANADNPFQSLFSVSYSQPGHLHHRILDLHPGSRRMVGRGCCISCRGSAGRSYRARRELV
jgi:hypothetical protein